MSFNIPIYILKTLVEVPGRETSKLPKRLKKNGMRALKEKQV